jgi:predicted dehydrogenase
MARRLGLAAAAVVSSTTMAPPRVAVVGLGYGRAHIPAFQAQGCPVVAVCQRDESAARGVARRYGIDQVFTRWEAMLERARPEIVVVATPPHLHRPIALSAFASGAHVLCEKPLAMSAAEGREMIQAARDARRVAMTAFNWRAPVAMQRFHELATSGAVGRVLHLSGRWVNPRWADESTSGTWRMTRAEAGMGAMGDQGVHLVDLVQWTVGPIARVCAQAGIAYPSRSAPGATGPADAEDFCTVLAETASGAQATLIVSRVAHGINEHGLEIHGTAGALGYRMGRDTARWWTGEVRAAKPGEMLRPLALDDRGPDIADTDPLDIVGRATLAPLAGRMLRAIAAGEPAAPSLEDGLRAQVVLDAVQQSLTRRAWVDVAAA